MKKFIIICLALCLILSLCGFTYVGKDVDDVWKEIQDIYDTLRDWYNDYFLYSESIDQSVSNLLLLYFCQIK